LHPALKLHSHRCNLHGNSHSATGRAISLVSKYINETSKYTKYQPIALRSLNQALALASLLEHISSGDHRVCHLFISTKSERLLHKERIMPDISSALRRIPSLLSHTLERNQSEGRRNPHKDRIEEGLSGMVLTRILTATAPSLQTLSIAIHDPSIWGICVL
jgi:hypothetical protein